MNRKFIVCFFVFFGLHEFEQAEACQNYLVTKTRSLEGMSYIDGKKVFLENGFKASVVPDNVQKLGYDDKDIKVTQDCYGSSFICNEYPEIRHCKSLRECEMQFRDNKSRVLTVIVGGNLLEREAKILRVRVLCSK